MREPIRDIERLRHIIENIDILNKYVEGRDRRELEKDPVVFYGLVKRIEMIGEAAYKLTNEFRDTHPATPWKMIMRMRHVLVHDYYQIDAAELWLVVDDDLPILRPQIEAYIKELSE